MDRNYYLKLFILFLVNCSVLETIAQTNDSITIKGSPDSLFDMCHEDNNKANGVTQYGISSGVTEDSLLSIINKLNTKLEQINKKDYRNKQNENGPDTVWVLSENHLKLSFSEQREYYDSIFDCLDDKLERMDKKSDNGILALRNLKMMHWLFLLFGLVVFSVLFFYLNKSNRKKINTEIDLCKQLGNTISKDISNVETSINNTVGNTMNEIIGYKSDVSNFSNEFAAMKTSIADVLLCVKTLRKEEAKQTTVLQSKPTVDTYNHCINEFITLNNHIYSLRRKETKKLLLSMYRLLSLQETNTRQLLQEIKEYNISDNEKEQFVSLVSQIESFLGNKVPIIDSWLACEKNIEVNDYVSGIRFPIGQQFDENLDRDIIGDDLTGEFIGMVYKMGYYFPGNTIAPYREKSIVSV